MSEYESTRREKVWQKLGSSESSLSSLILLVASDSCMKYKLKDHITLWVATSIAILLYILVTTMKRIANLIINNSQGIQHNTADILATFGFSLPRL